MSAGDLRDEALMPKRKLAYRKAGGLPSLLLGRRENTKYHHVPYKLDPTEVPALQLITTYVVLEAQNGLLNTK